MTFTGLSRRIETKMSTKLARVSEKAKRRVLKEYPSAWFNAKERTIEGYSESLILGRGSVIAKSIEASAWIDAAKNLRRKK